MYIMGNHSNKNKCTEEEEMWKNKEEWEINKHRLHEKEKIESDERKEEYKIRKDKEKEEKKIEKDKMKEEYKINKDRAKEAYKISKDMEKEEKKIEKDKWKENKKYGDIDYIENSRKIFERLNDKNFDFFVTRSSTLPYRTNFSETNETSEQPKYVELVICNGKKSKIDQLPICKNDLYQIDKIKSSYDMEGGKKKKNLSSDLENENIGDTDTVSSSSVSTIMSDSSSIKGKNTDSYSANLQSNIESSDLYRLQKRIFNSVSSEKMLTSDTETLAKAVKQLENANKYNFNKNSKYH